MMINFKEETLKVLKEHGKTINDVVWVGNDEVEYSMTSLLNCWDVEYDNGFGGTEVDEDLLIVGKDWWLERDEYDGSEWWEFKSLPKRPDKIVEISSVLYKDERYKEGRTYNESD